MSARGNEVLDAALAELRSLGVTDAKVEQNRHVHIRFTWRGHPTLVTVPVSPSDRMCVTLKLQDIRRQLGVKRDVERSPRSSSRRARRSCRVADAPDSFTVKPDPWLVLEGLLK